MTRHLYAWGIIFLLTLFSINAEDLNIVNDGKSDYSILVAPKSLDSVKSAADELQQLIKKVTGVEIPITDTATKGHKYLVIGANPLTVSNVITTKDLKKDGFKIIECDENIFLLGNDKDITPSQPYYSWSSFLESDSVGSYFATMEFARRFLGVEWYMPGEKGISWQPKSRIAVPKGFKVTENPHFKDRYIDGVRRRSKRYLKKLMGMGILRDTYYNEQIHNECMHWGRHMLLGNNKPLNFQHAWFYYLPAKEPTRRSSIVYGKTHPEYYALVGGARQNFYYGSHHGGQLCVSNPEVAKVYADNIIAYHKKTGREVFSLSQNDGGGQCECDKCQAWDGKDPVTGKRVYADRFIRFANRVAERVVKEVPNARLGILAYGVGVHPPVADIKIHPNVFISDVYNFLPNIWCSSEDERKRIREYSRGWRNNASHVIFTTYHDIYGNWGLPWDSTEVASTLVKELSDFQASDGFRMYNCRYFGLSPGVDGARLWVLARLFWNPDQDYRKLRDDYYRGAFGEKAGQYIKEYFDTIHKATANVMEKYPCPLEKKNIPIQCTYPEKIYNPIRKKCRELLNLAKKAAENENERIKWRVDRVLRAWKFTELTLDSVKYAKLARTGKYKELGLTQKQAWEKAVAAGRERRKMMHDFENYYALAQGSADECQRQRPIGIVEKMPESANLKISVPLKKSKMNLDGKLDEEVWNELKATSTFRNNRTGKNEPVKTWTKIFRTEDAFVIGFHCDEPKMVEMNTVNEPDKIWCGDVVEIYISQTGSRLDYSQFLVNPNSMKKAYIMRGDQGVDNKWNPDWTAKAFKGKDFWSVEIRLPFKSISVPPDELESKTIFIDFFRERYTGGKHVLYAWTPTRGGFAQPAKFGRMSFKPNDSG